MTLNERLVCWMMDGKRFKDKNGIIIDSLSRKQYYFPSQLVDLLNEMDEDINDYQDCIFQRDEKYEKIDEILNTKVMFCDNPYKVLDDDSFEPRVEMHTFHSLLMKQADEIKCLEAKCKDMGCSIRHNEKELIEMDSLISELNNTLFEKGELIEELYTFRLLYNAHLFNEWNGTGKYEVYKSRRHDDGTLCYDGEYFIVVANLPTGQVSNHYPMVYWDLFKIPSYERMKDKWDGHTSNDVLFRLIMLIKEAVDK